MAFIAVIALFAVAGRHVGAVVRAPIAGAVLGGFIGLLLGFTLTYLRYRDL